MLLTTITEKCNVPFDWWMSEKYDGIRAVWDTKHLYTRSGIIIPAPRKFIDALPNFSVDGELWLGYRRFDELNHMFMNSDDPRWSDMQYKVFDLFSNQVYKKHYERLKKIENRFVKIVKQFEIKNCSNVERFVSSVIKRGGEGIVVRDPNAYYQCGKRSPSVKKWKPIMVGKAKVIDIKKKGKLKSLYVEFNGHKFYLNGYNSKIIPEPGTFVEFKYNDVTVNGVPRHAVWLHHHQ